MFVDKNVVGWRPIAKAWLESRTQQEVHVREAMLGVVMCTYTAVLVYSLFVLLLTYRAALSIVSHVSSFTHKLMCIYKYNF